jgi:phosphinothricin acetyltransferase
MIRNVHLDDAQRIVEIYNPYILNTIITFEEETIDEGEMEKRIGHVLEQGLPWIVIESDGVVIGYAYAGAWRTRTAYRYTVETTIYLNRNFMGKGYGRQLYAALLDCLKQKGIHTAIAGISLPNERSVGLHESLGFRKIAEFREVGYKFGKWVDVGFWQLML